MILAPANCKRLSLFQANRKNNLPDPILLSFVQMYRHLTEQERNDQSHRELLARAERQARELALLDQVRTALAREIDMPIILRTVVEAIASTFDYQLVSIYVVQNEAFILQHQVGYDQVISSIPINQGICGRALYTGRPVLVEDVHNEPDFLGAIEGIVSEVAVPLFLRGLAIGVLNVESTKGVKLGEADQSLLVTLGKDINIAFERAQLYAAVRESEERFRTSIETLLDGFAIFSAIRDGSGQITDFRYEFINEAGCRLNQRRVEEHIGHTILELLPEHKDTGLIAEYAQIVETCQPLSKEMLHYEDIYGSGQHLSRAFDVRAVKLGDGIAVAWRDVTERRQMVIAEHDQRILAEALADTAAALISTPHLDEVLNRILDNAKRVVPYESVNIMLVEDGVARMVDFRRNTENSLEDFTHSIRLVVADIPNLRWMAEQGKPLVIPDTHADKGWVQFPETRWIKSYAGAPVRIKGRTIGFINLNAAQPAFFTQAHADRLLAFANQAAIAIENAQLFGEVQRFARRMALLNDITQMAIKTPDLTSLLRMLAGRLGELFDADGACITLWDETEPQTIPAEGLGASNEMEMPLIANGRKLGTALIHYDQRHAFTQEDIALGDQVAGQVALAIAKVQSFEAELKRTEQLTRANSMVLALSQVASQIEAASELDGVLKALGGELGGLGMNCLVALKEQDANNLFIRYLSLNGSSVPGAEDPAGLQWSAFRFHPATFPFFEKVVIQKQAVFSSDAVHVVTSALPDLDHSLQESFNELIGITEEDKLVILPMTAKEQVTGILWIWGKGLEETDLPAASVFASQVALALEKAQLLAQRQQLAITDELTGLYNRRGLYELGRREVERALRFDHPLSAVILDIDHFKKINDTYGHATGDQVLQLLSERCRENLRGVDIIGRYGGEEFVILLPESDLSEARKVAERLRKNISSEPFLTRQGEVQITASLGVTAVNGHGKDLSSLIERADQALYTAKQCGRNCVAST